MKKPLPTTREEVKRYRFLESLGAVEEIGLQFAIRGSCLLANKRYKEAAQAYAYANELYTTQLNRASMEATMYRWHKHLDIPSPAPLPRVRIKNYQRTWPKLPIESETKYSAMCALEDLVEIERRNGIKRLVRKSANYNFTMAGW